MILNYWFEKGVFFLYIIVFILLGTLTFGYPVYFDFLFICILLAMVGAIKISHNFFSISLSLIFIRVLYEVLYQISSIASTKWLFYSLALGVVYKFKFDPQVKKFLFPVIILMIFAEVSWAVNEYPAPQVFSLLGALIVNVSLRAILVFRSHIMKTHFRLEASSVPLDFSLYRLAGCSNILIGTLIIEYLIRHSTPLKPTLIYEFYSYGQQTISLITLYLILAFTLRFKLSA